MSVTNNLAMSLRKRYSLFITYMDAYYLFIQPMDSGRVVYGIENGYNFPYPRPFKA